MSTDVFPFERLPPELRNLVYGFVLVADTPVRIGRKRRYRPGRREEFALKSTIEIPRKRSDSTKSVPFLPKNALSVLRLNKALHREASPILYSGNTFIFTNHPTFRQFAGEAKRALPYVERIRLADWSPSFLQQTLFKLRAAAGLQHLELAIPTCCCMSGDRIHEDLYPGVKAFVQSSEDPEAARHRFDMITFAACVEGTHSHRSCRQQRRVEPVAKAQLTQEVKDALEKWFIGNGVFMKMGAGPA